MSGYAIIDTETSGLADFSKPADAEGQPRLVQFAMIRVNEQLELEDELLFYIRPDGWEVSPEAQAVHGISTGHLNDNGVPVHVALACYRQAIEEGRQVIGHNVHYDTKVMRGELRRAQLPDLYAQTKTFCTMRASAQPCQEIHGGKHKWPKLAEASEWLLGYSPPKAHDALADAHTCLEVLRWLHARALFPA